MNYLYKLLAVGCVMLLVSLNGVARAASSPDDTSEETNAAAATFSGGNLADIDVASYLIRNLYREPDKDASDLDNWLRGWLISLYWNPNVAIHNEMHKEELATAGFGFNVSKDMSPASTFRLDYSYRDNQGYYAINRKHRLSFDYLFNISNFYYGYDLSRENEWLLTMGLHAGMTQNKPGTRDSIDVVHQTGATLGWVGTHLGLQYRKNISNDMAFFMESQFELNSNNSDGISNAYHVDPSLNLLVGLIYRLGEPKRNIARNYDEANMKWYNNTFIQLYGGYSWIKTQEEIKFDGAGKYTGNLPGMNFGFNIGKYLNPALGFRLGFFESAMGHNTKPDPADINHKDYNNFMTIRGGRLELLFNPLAVFIDKTSIGRIGWDVSAGVEVSQIHLHHYGYNNYIQYHANDPSVTFANGNKPNIGLTLGTQLKYFVNNHTALFAEGRMTPVKFTAGEGDGFTLGSGPYTGQISESAFAASLGIEYYIGGFDRYERFKRWDTYETKPIERLEKNKRLYLEAATGIGHQIHWGEHYPNTTDIEGTIGLGMRYNHTYGGRVRLSYGYRNSGLPNSASFNGNPNVGRSSDFIRLSADATVSITDLLLGVDETGERIGDLYFFAGPTLATYAFKANMSKFDMHSWGAEAGVQLVRRLTPEWELFIEPRY